MVTKRFLHTMRWKFSFARQAVQRINSQSLLFPSTTRGPPSFLDNIAKGAFNPLKRIAPVFYTKGTHVVPLYEPKEFYTELKTRILSAKKDVFIATLYIGQSERELVDTIRTALKRTDTLRIHILVDCLRGTRTLNGQSTATLLLPLIKDFPGGRVKVSMYHTPDLKGLLKKTLPQRFNESIGLMHMKVYGFDDTVMLSGANLSSDYFTNRQDRSIVFDQQPDLTLYYKGLVECVGSFSYQLGVSEDQTPYQLTMEPDRPDPVKQSGLFKHQMRSQIDKYMSTTLRNPSTPEEHDDTAIFPAIQMGPLGIRQDEKMTMELLEINNRQKSEKEDWWTFHLTSGYFNFTDRYKTCILRTRAYFRFITASPEANGFFGSKGISKFLPPAYTHIEREFYRNVERLGKQDAISIEEYRRPGWTYHAKGLWIRLAQQAWPSVTTIGSTNFGHRSSNRDLEAQAVVVTCNETLQRALDKEVSGLEAYSNVVSGSTFAVQDRKVSYSVRMATAMIKTML
ncbi:hypothetical protein BDF14DRAFT_1858466 [Spinellus fusiger]|nr:hypothetical protein BDF14DRAFT_1858466 [Spinellus fusiger]